MARCYVRLTSDFEEWLWTSALKPDISCERPLPALRIAAEVCLTLGVLVALFVGYELLWTNHATGEAQRAAASTLQRAWKPPAASKGAPADPKPRLGEPFAMLRIPRLGDAWQWAVYEGVRRDDLRKGPGHYPDTARPGQVGNAVIAGHRTTNGEPFAHLDRLRKGDQLVLETASRRVVYRVDATEIVPPTRVSVLLPVPNEPGVRPTKARLTLVTCHPRWGSTSRLITYATLVSSTERGLQGKV